MQLAVSFFFVEETRRKFCFRRDDAVSFLFLEEKVLCLCHISQESPSFGGLGLRLLPVSMWLIIFFASPNEERKGKLFPSSAQMPGEELPTRM